MAYAVKRMYHPSHRVPDLAEAETFFEEVFGRKSFTLADYLGYGGRELDPRYPTDYSIFTPIADVLFDCIDPTRYVYDGIQRYESVESPELHGLGWFVDGIEDLWWELRRHGIRGTDQRNVLPEGEGPPVGYLGDTPLIFTVAEDSGLRYEFAPSFDHPMDPRSDPAWSISQRMDGDPLGIEHCSHHTILTDSFDRAQEVLVDVLGGKVIHEGRNQLLETESKFVSLADAVYELAVPERAGAPAMDDWQRNAPQDTYHSLTWKVTDLQRVADHLGACKIRIRAQDDAMIITDPADALGIPWGFTTVSTPGDSR